MSDEKDKQDQPQGAQFRAYSVGRKYDSAFAEPVSADQLGGPDTIRSNALQYEDEFAGSYTLGALAKDSVVIEPRYKFLTLERLLQENNSLEPCVAAMVTNVDGTGYTIEAEEDFAQDPTIEAEIVKLKEFFDEPYPGMSFSTIRKLMRKDLETTGNGYIEVMRNMNEEIVFLRHIEAKTMRMMNLDKPYVAEKTVMRGGQEVSLSVSVRERRYVQKIGAKSVFFKEFGAGRDLNKNTGLWAPVSKTFGFRVKATEVIHLTLTKDPETPYGLPRWLTQAPSIVGSRKAEEYNTSFFENGGVPPMMIVLSGGQLIGGSKQAIDMHFASESSKHTPLVLEVSSTAGTIDSANNAKVMVERFGGDRQSDSMFEGYDNKCEERVRRSFRLPPLFVGKMQDYNYASAFASYIVAEAQVFKPERELFDEIINLKLLSELTPNYRRIKFKSSPLSVTDVKDQLAAVGMASAGGAISKEELVERLNELANMDMKFDSAAAQAGMLGALMGAPPPAGTPAPDGVNAGPGGTPQAPTSYKPIGGNFAASPAFQAPSMKSDLSGVVALAQEAAYLINNNNNGPSFISLVKSISGLSEVQKSVFKAALATELYQIPAINPRGMEDLAVASLFALSKNGKPENAG